jgi:hypothetical protein
MSMKFNESIKKVEVENKKSAESARFKSEQCLKVFDNISVVRSWRIIQIRHNMWFNNAFPGEVA